jgi:hypothetical protein
MIFIWMMAVFALGKQFDALTAKDSRLDIPDPTPAKQPQLMKEGA